MKDNKLKAKSFFTNLFLCVLVLLPVAAIELILIWVNTNYYGGAFNLILVHVGCSLLATVAVGYAPMYDYELKKFDRIYISSKHKIRIYTFRILFVAIFILAMITAVVFHPKYTIQDAQSILSDAGFCNVELVESTQNIMIDDSTNPFVRKALLFSATNSSGDSQLLTFNVNNGSWETL